MLIPNYHLQFTFGYQIRFRTVSSGIKNVQKYQAVLGFLKRARAGLRVENHEPVPTAWHKQDPNMFRMTVKHFVRIVWSF